MESAVTPPGDRGAGGPLDERELAAFLVLSRLPGVGDRTFRTVVSRFGTARAALAAPFNAFADLAGPAAAQRRAASDLKWQTQQVLRRVRRGRIHAMAFPGVEELPMLEDLHDPPNLLFTIGDRDLLRRPAVAIVGARRATEAGRRIAAHVAAGLARAGVVVVSGMALGIDAAAHRGALSVSGPTVAVLASGADRPSPRTNLRLHQDICRTGVVVSEFWPGAPALPHCFPKRNRIIAALTRAVVVVEAGERSGALITVDHALDLGREVFAVPGPLESAQSRGTNALIRDGARILLSPGQIIEELGLGDPNAVRPDAPGPLTELDAQARKIWDALDAEPRHVDALARDLGISVPGTLGTLATLEMEGYVVQRPGMRFSRTRPGEAGPVK